MSDHYIIEALVGNKNDDCNSFTFLISLSVNGQIYIIMIAHEKTTFFNLMVELKVSHQILDFH